MSEAACAESQSARSATLRDKNAELIDLDQYIPEVGNLMGGRVELSCCPKTNTLIAWLRRWGRLAISESNPCGTKMLTRSILSPADSRKLSYWHTIPFSLSENSPVLNLVNEYHINFRDQYGVVIEPRLHEQRLHFACAGMPISAISRRTIRRSLAIFMYPVEICWKWMRMFGAGKLRQIGSVRK